MDLRSLNIFLEAAELGSFTRTGEKLGYSQPTISFQIKLLEKELGVQLFDRIGHTVSLTDAGRNLLPYAQQICHLSEEMLSGGTAQGEPDGILRLGIPDSLCGTLIAAHFRQFSQTYPKISLHLATGDTGQLLDYLDHNEVDMICTIDERVYNTNYVIADEEEIGVHFVASPQNPLAGRGTVSLAELVTQPCLLTDISLRAASAAFSAERMAASPARYSETASSASPMLSISGNSSASKVTGMPPFMAVRLRVAASSAAMFVATAVAVLMSSIFILFTSRADASPVASLCP